MLRKQVEPTIIIYLPNQVIKNARIRKVAKKKSDPQKSILCQPIYSTHSTTLLLTQETFSPFLHDAMNSSLASRPRSSDEALYVPHTKVLPFSEVLQHLLFSHIHPIVVYAMAIWLYMIMFIGGTNSIGQKEIIGPAGTVSYSTLYITCCFTPCLYWMFDKCG